jgi:hypothetical protein
MCPESTISANEAVVPCDVEVENIDADDPVWAYVEPCTTRYATKSADIHTALEQHVGKVQARKLLARTKATVAQDTTGKKNRVLRLDRSLLKLRVHVSK